MRRSPRLPRQRRRRAFRLRAFRLRAKRNRRGPSPPAPRDPRWVPSGPETDPALRADDTLRLWNADTLQPIGAPLTGHQGAVFAVAFGPDGRRLAFGGHDLTIRLWDAATGQQVGAPLMLAGLSAGGALGAIAGGVATAIEGHLPHGSGLDIVGTYDPPDKDEVPAAGAGKTIRPSGVVAAGGGLDDQIWAAKQGLIGPDGRRYDFIVDRATQGWWPNTDNDEKGFRGRWGQQVTSDFLPRRSGPRFPDYAKLFLLALAYRDSHPVFKSGG